MMMCFLPSPAALGEGLKIGNFLGTRAKARDDECAETYYRTRSRGL